MSGLYTTGTSKVKKCKNITIKLLDKNGVPTINPSLGDKMFISIYNDVVTVDLSKNADEPIGAEKRAISVYGYEAESEGIYKYLQLAEDEDIYENIVPYLSRMTFVDLDIKGITGTDTISAGLMSAFFRFFSCININNSASSPINLPAGDFKVESFAISGGDIILSGGISIQADSFISLENNKLYSSFDITKLNLLSKKVTVYNVSTTKYIPITVIAPKASSTNEFMETEVSMSNIRYNLSDTSDKVSLTEVKEEPLISISDINTVRLSDIYITNAYGYKGIKLEKITTAMLTNIERVSDKSIYGYTLGLSNIMTTYVSGFKVTSNLKNERDVYAIFIAGAGLKYNQQLAVSDFTIYNCGLIDLGASKADSIFFSSGQIISNTLLDYSEFNVTRSLRFSGCKINLTKRLALYGNEIDIMDCTIRLAYSEDNFKHFTHVDNKLLIDNTTIYGEVDYEFEVSNGGGIEFNSSDVSMRSLDFKLKSDKFIEKTNYVNDSDRILVFTSSNVVTSKGITVDGLYRVSADKTSFDCESIDLRNTKVEFSPLAVTKASGIKYIFNNVEFKNTVINSKNTHSSKFFITESSGLLSYKIDDVESEEEKIKLETEITDSKVDFKIDSAYPPVDVTVKSDDSVGSTVFGMHNNIHIIPSMKSKDITSFATITDFKDRNSYNLNYGNSPEEISINEMMGLKE